MKISCVDYHINNIWNNSLQFASDVITIWAYLKIFQNAAVLITKCVGSIYYKVLQPYYTMHTLLQNAAIVVTKRVTYYKMRGYYKMPQNTEATAPWGLRSSPRPMAHFLQFKSRHI